LHEHQTEPAFIPIGSRCPHMSLYTHPQISAHRCCIANPRHTRREGTKWGRGSTKPSISPHRPRISNPRHTRREGTRWGWGSTRTSISTPRPRIANPRRTRSDRIYLNWISTHGPRITNPHCTPSEGTPWGRMGQKTSVCSSLLACTDPILPHMPLYFYPWTLDL
jgi:hypothetical protein